MVKHGHWYGNFVLRALFLLDSWLSVQLFLYFLNAGEDVLDLLVEEVFHVLRVGLDLNDDVAMMLFELWKSEGPIGLNELFLVGLHRLKEHIGFVVDFMSPQEFLKGFL